MRKGELAEQHISLMLQEQGFKVARYLTTERADIITDWHGTLKRVQIKTTRQQKSGKPYFDLRQSQRTRGSYSPDEIDAFVLESFNYKGIWIVPISRLSGIGCFNPSDKSLYYNAFSELK